MTAQLNILRAHRINAFQRAERVETVAPNSDEKASYLHDIGKALVHEEAVVPDHHTTPMCPPLETLPARQVPYIQATDSTHLAHLLGPYWLTRDR